MFWIIRDDLNNNKFQLSYLHEFVKRKPTLIWSFELSGGLKKLRTFVGLVKPNKFLNDPENTFIDRG